MNKLKALAERAAKNHSAYNLTVACLAADALDKLSTEAMDALESEPENEELDAAADKAYKEFWDTCRAIAEMLVDITGGMMDEKTALKMALHKRAGILNIYDKANQK